MKAECALCPPPRPGADAPADAASVSLCSAMANARACFVLGDAHLVKTLREEGNPLVEPTGDADRDDALALRDMRLREMQRKFEELEEYRLALLAVDSQPGFPVRVEWPPRPW